MKTKYNLKITSFLVLFFMMFVSCQLHGIRESKTECEGAFVKIAGDNIIASTGRAIRVWELSEFGLSTVSFKTVAGKSIVKTKSSIGDWYFPWMDEEPEGKLISVESCINNDEGFMNEFIRTTVEFHYPVSKIGLKYDIWTMPGAPGFRTQISLKALDGFKANEEFSHGVVEQLVRNNLLKKGQAIGYFNDTQHRNMAGTPILKTEVVDVAENQEIDWANVLVVSGDKEGFILAKESHKCANQQGVNTGGFKLAAQNISVTGAGLDLEHLTNEYQPCWATWSIAYYGNEADAKLALKQFDRKRYPIDPNRDIYIMSNTWGSGSSGANSKYASCEENILKELKV
ncbi:hypothetical protein EMN47_03250 [Prolixibacteraceae bacterium JC049]|nr:hypothetical protein [Prolixibacteraceae bacterium JC049]